MGKYNDILILPRGWKREVAKRLGCHPNTVANAVREKNYNYPRVVKVAKELYN